MGRISGARNKDYEATRQRLAQSLAMQVAGSGGKPLSFKQLAQGADVDPGTLRHYFEDKEGALRAAFEVLISFGGPRMAQARSYASLPAREALFRILTEISGAWEGFLGGMHAAGFAEGMSSSAIGQLYVASVLEPTLSVVEELLSYFHGRGELRVPQPRVAALALMSPLLLALFHQHQLSGNRCRPLEMKPFLAAHLDGFLSGYGPTPESESSS